MVAQDDVPAAVSAVAAALDAAERGDLSLQRRLVLALSGVAAGPAAAARARAPPPPDAPPPPADILTALTHFSVSFSADARRRAALRALLRAAVYVDFAALAPARPARAAAAAAADDAAPDPEPDARLVDAYADFARNAASADSAFVEDLFAAFTRKHFCLPLPRFARVLDASHAVIARILASYTHAEATLVRVVADRYPHPVRAAAEHVLYARAVLRIVSYAPSHALASGLLAVVIEKMTVIDAMVSDSFSGARTLDVPSGTGSPVTPEISSPGSSTDVAVSQRPDEDDSADPDAAKMDAVLLEFVSYVDDSLAQASGGVAGQRFKSIVGAFERFVLPAQGARHAPFLLMYAAASLGHARVLTTAERFRWSFFDPNEAHSVRIAYLYCSAALVSRCKCVTARDVLDWMSKMAKYVHEYVDDAVSVSCIDVEDHDMFYAAVYAMMSVVSTRRDVFDCALGGDADASHQLRLLRLMSSTLNPLLVMPSNLVEAFCQTLDQSIDFDGIRERNLTRTLPSRTRLGGTNRFYGFMPLEPCLLPRSKARISPLYISVYHEKGTISPSSPVGSKDTKKRPNSVLSESKSQDALEPVAKRRRVDTI